MKVLLAMILSMAVITGAAFAHEDFEYFGTTSDVVIDNTSSSSCSGNNSYSMGFNSSDYNYDDSPSNWI